MSPYRGKSRTTCRRNTPIPLLAVLLLPLQGVFQLSVLLPRVTFRSAPFCPGLMACYPSRALSSPLNRGTEGAPQKSSKKTGNKTCITAKNVVPLHRGSDPGREDVPGASSDTGGEENGRPPAATNDARKRDKKHIWTNPIAWLPEEGELSCRR